MDVKVTSYYDKVIVLTIREVSGILDDFPEGRGGKDDGDKGWKPPHGESRWGTLDSLEVYDHRWGSLRFWNRTTRTSRSMFEQV